MQAYKTCPDPAFNALTCLANLAAHHGVDGEVRDYLPLCRGFERPANLFSLIHLARLLGLRAVPLEGPFSALPECNLPVIVPLRGAEPRFAVVLAIDEDQVQLLDSVMGPTGLDHHSFRQQWENASGEGDVLDLSPGDGFPDLPRRLRDARNPLKRLKWSLGLRPPWTKKLAFLALSLLTLLTPLLLASPAQLGLTLALAACVVLSLWSLMFADSCASCQGTAKLAGGLPLAAAGTACYSLLVALPLAELPRLNLALALAFGIHAALLATLARNRLFCLACLCVATCAAIAVLFQHQIQPFTYTDGATSLSAAALTWGLLAWARHHHKLTAFHNAFVLAQSVWSEPTLNQNGQVRAVVFKREHCSWCMLYEAVVRPALEQEFGDLIAFEERDAIGKGIDVPLMFLQGSENVIVLDLHCEAAHAHARRGVQRALGQIPEQEGNSLSVVL